MASLYSNDPRIKYGSNRISKNLSANQQLTLHTVALSSSNLRFDWPISRIYHRLCCYLNFKMKKLRHIYPTAGLLLLFAFSPIIVFAEEGLPGSPEFGYGACLDIEGYHIERSIEIADNYGLDWVTIEFNWGDYQYQQEISPDWSALDRAITNINNSHLSVIVSITNAPSWAIDSSGPKINATIALTLAIAQRYPDHVLAIELFPDANMEFGWGVTPNPQAYVELIKAVQFALRNQGLKHTLIAAGINPASNYENSLQFLNDLYYHDIASHSSIISIRLPTIAYSPDTHPEEVENLTLRFYEDARRIMLENGHQNGLIWITRFDWHPDQFNQPASQVEWLQQAFITLRSQLYIGAASYYCLNDPTSATNLISSSGDTTPIFNALGELIAAENNGVSITQPISSEKSASGEDSKPTSP